MFGGVCEGLAEYLDRDPLAVRILAGLALASGGVGIFAYALLWALVPVAPGSAGARRSRAGWLRTGLLALAVGGAVAALRLSGLYISNRAIWALALGLIGLALVWRQAAGGAAQTRERPWRSLGRALGHHRSVALPRILIGVLLVGGAAASLMHHFGVQASLGKAAGSVAIAGLLVTLLVVPWFARLGRSLAAERAARIRAHERADMAAHLHDSVLQTLALIQRRSQDAREVAALARHQERELRAWLFERAPARGDHGLKAALERAAADVEERQRVPIESVIVGDLPLDGNLEALVKAAREALTNAAKFAAGARIDLYAEVTPDSVEAFVRDRGPGFDPATIGPDRHGVRECIVGRMERQGGTATVRSAPGRGTEVELRLGTGGPRPALAAG
ncbi:MAG: PspC domain-containing protein [Acidobacteriota bacterium]|nr:PspC domain-containing protein [Acidobacteriota bacterium]